MILKEGGSELGMNSPEDLMLAERWLGAGVNFGMKHHRRA